MSTLAELIDGARAFLDPRLVSPANLARTQEVARLFPGGMTHMFGLECRLETQPCTPDLFLVCGPEARGGQDVLAGTCPAHELPTSLFHHGSWSRLRPFVRRWTEAGSLECRAVSQMFLEFDVEGPRASEGGAPVPIVFLRIVRDRLPGADRVAEKLAQLLNPLLERPLPAEVLACATRVVLALPQSAQFYLGLMLSRDPNVLRVVVRSTPRAYFELLPRIGWPGDLAAVRRHTNELVDPEIPLLFNLDVGADVRASYDFEYRLGGPESAGPGNARFLAQLQEMGLASAAQVEALGRWNGMQVARAHHELWPAYHLRWVNHIKLVFAHFRPARAKAYLMYGLLPVAQ